MVAPVKCGACSGFTTKGPAKLPQQYAVLHPSANNTIKPRPSDMDERDASGMCGRDLQDERAGQRTVRVAGHVG